MDIFFRNELQVFFFKNTVLFIVGDIEGQREKVIIFWDYRELGRCGQEDLGEVFRYNMQKNDSFLVWFDALGIYF